MEKRLHQSALLRPAIAASIACVGISAKSALGQPLDLVTGRIVADTGFRAEVSGTPLSHPDYSDFFPERHLFRQVGSDDAPLTSALGRIAVEADAEAGRGLEIEAKSHAVPAWFSAALVETQFKVLPVWRLSFLHNGVATRYLDAFRLRFSPEIEAVPVPEPSTLEMGAIGLSWLLVWRTRLWLLQQG
jgi:hypothetical protein